MIYESWGAALLAVPDLQCKLARIDQIIDALMVKMAEHSGSANIKEYQLDDGQTKIRTVYASTADIQRDINALEKLRHDYMNRATGRVVRLRDARNF